MGKKSRPIDTFVTFDTDWAPDFMIHFTAELLAKFGVRATWFLTHDSPETRRLRANPRFEIGIHPNFHAGSSHGSTVSQVLRTCARFAPKARVMRTHDLFQSTTILSQCARESGARLDVSILMPRVKHLSAFRFDRKLTRAPYYFDDSFEMMQSTRHWSLRSFDLKAPGLKIFNFHPVHVFSNFSRFADYERHKSKIYRARRVSDLNYAERENSGSRTLLTELLEHLREHGPSSTLLSGVRSFS